MCSASAELWVDEMGGGVLRSHQLLLLSTFYNWYFVHDCNKNVKKSVGGAVEPRLLHTIGVTNSIPAEAAAISREKIV